MLTPTLLACILITSQNSRNNTLPPVVIKAYTPCHFGDRRRRYRNRSEASRRWQPEGTVACIVGGESHGWQVVVGLGRWEVAAKKRASLKTSCVKTSVNTRDWLREGEGLAAGMRGIGCARAGDWLRKGNGLAVRGRGIATCVVNEGHWLCEGEGRWASVWDWLREWEGLATRAGGIGYAGARDWLCKREGLATRAGGTGCASVRDLLHEREGLATQVRGTDCARARTAGQRPSVSRCQTNKCVSFLAR
jgi:hypothetical protein